MAKIFTPLIAFMLLAAAAQAFAEPVPVLAGRDIDVLKAALHTQCTNPNSAPSVVSDQPAGMEATAIHKDWKAETTLKDLGSRASETSRWPQGVLCKNTQIVAESRLAGIPPDARAFPGTAGFAKTFDGARALRTISRPLFTTDGKHAVIATNYMCGPLCGHGELIELELAKDGWKIVKARMTWIS